MQRLIRNKKAERIDTHGEDPDHQIGGRTREAACTRVLNCHRQKQQKMCRVIRTEVDVSLQKDGYILGGEVDLLVGGDG